MSFRKSRPIFAQLPTSATDDATSDVSQRRNALKKVYGRCAGAIRHLSFGKP